MTQARILTAGLEMAEVLSELHTICFDPLPETPWPATAMRTILRMPGIHSYALWDCEPAPVGLLIGRETRDEAEVLTVCVSPTARRKGFARDLFTAFIGDIACGTRLVLEVAVDNKNAIDLYKSLKFQEVGRRPNYYRVGKSRIDALIMARQTASVV